MKVRLREIEVYDLEQLKNWRNSPVIRRRTREYRLLNMEDQRKWFKRVSEDRNTAMFGIEVSTDRFWILVGVCGLCSIDWIGRKAEVSIYIGNEDYRHRGVGTKVLMLLENKAFDEYNLRKLYAEVYSNNYIGEELFEKCGYVKEGILQEHVFKDGCYLDSTMYALSREGEDEN